MRYPVLIEEGGADRAFGVVVPDLPGCFSAGDMLDEAIEGAREAAAAWVDAAFDGDQRVPPASSLDQVRNLPEYAAWMIWPLPAARAAGPSLPN